MNFNTSQVKYCEQQSAFVCYTVIGKGLSSLGLRYLATFLQSANSLHDETCTNLIPAKLACLKITCILWDQASINTKHLGKEQKQCFETVRFKGQTVKCDLVHFLPLWLLIRCSLVN